MPTYIVLHELSGENLEHLQTEIADGKAILDEMECELHDLYLTFGRFDAVGIIDAPDDETAAQFVMTLARENDVGTETLRAFPEDETEVLLEGMPE